MGSAYLAGNLGVKLAAGALLALSLVSAPAFAGPAKVKTVVVATEFGAKDTGPAVTYPASLEADLHAAITSRLADKGLIAKGSGAKLRVALKNIEFSPDAEGGARLSAYVREGYRQQSSKSGISYHSFWPAVVVPQVASDPAATYKALVDALAGAVVAHISQ